MILEQTIDFNKVKRILRTVAPEYRALSTPEIKSDETILDVTTKTIGVGETTSLLHAIAAILFQIGHLLLRKAEEYALIFGEGIKTWAGTDRGLINRLARLSNQADIAAAKWAAEVYASNWPHVDLDFINEAVSRYVWSEKEWAEYYTA